MRREAGGAVGAPPESRGLAALCESGLGGNSGGREGGRPRRGESLSARGPDDNGDVGLTTVMWG